MNTFGSTTKRFDSLTSPLEHGPETQESQLEREMKSGGDDLKHHSSTPKLRHEAKSSSVFASSSTRFQPTSKILGPSPGDYEVSRSTQNVCVIDSEACLTRSTCSFCLLFFARSKARGAPQVLRGRSNLRASDSRANPTAATMFRFVRMIVALQTGQLGATQADIFHFSISTHTQGPGHYSAAPVVQKPVHMARPDVFYGAVSTWDGPREDFSARG